MSKGGRRHTYDALSSASPGRAWGGARSWAARNRGKDGIAFCGRTRKCVLLWPRCKHLVGLLLILASSATACQVPVFRYALERWTADPYDLVLVSYRELSADEQAARAELEAAQQRCNLNLHTAPGERWQAAFESVKADDPPQLLLYYPRRAGAPFWQGELNGENVARIIDSPLRQQIAADLLAGTSTVWIQIDSGDARSDEQAARMLAEHLAAAAASTEIPEGVLPIDHGPDAGPVDLDDVLRSSIPLEIAFRTHRLSREEPAEAVFLAMLQQLAPELLALRQPLAVPVFGRGRALEGIPAEAINAGTIAGAAGYLCGACSCQVKSENPGQDLLMAVDWDSHMLGNLIIEDKTLPPLTGFADGSHASDERPPAAAAPRWRLPLIATLLFVALLIAGGTVYLLRR
jgi:hypothetical protein